MQLPRRCLPNGYHGLVDTLFQINELEKHSPGRRIIEDLTVTMACGEHFALMRPPALTRGAPMLTLAGTVTTNSSRIRIGRKGATKAPV